MKNKITFILLVIIIFSILFIREPDNILNYELSLEDSTLIFSHYYNNRDFESVWRFYNGYVSIIPNLAGYFSIFLPAIYIPLAIGAVPVFFAALGFSLFYSRRFRIFIPSDLYRFIICIILAIIPLGNQWLVGNTMFSLWSLLIILLLLSIGELPAGNIMLIFQIVFMSFLIWSHPLSIVAIPIFIFQVFRKRNIKYLISYVFLIIAVILYNRFGVINKLHFDMGLLVNKIFACFLYISERVIFEGFLGNKARNFFVNNYFHYYITFYSLVFIISLALIVREFWSNFKISDILFLLTSLYIIIMLSFLVSLTRGANFQDPMGQRYGYVQRFFFILFLLYIIFKFGDINKINIVNICLVSIFVIHLVLLQINNLCYYRILNSKNGLEVKEFVRELYEIEKSRKTRKGIKKALLRDGWDIKVDTTHR